MTSARYSQVTDELLSAYLDDAVTPEERRWVEDAVADDPGIAWRLESLRTTVQLLHELPALALPRSFALTPEQLQAGELAPAVAIAPTPALPAQPMRTPKNEVGVWSRLVESWQRFWAPGNPVFRNAMAASFAALLFLMIVPGVLAPAPQPATVTEATANVSNAEVTDTVAAVAPAQQAQPRTDAEVQLRRHVPQPTAIPATGVPPATAVSVAQDTPAIVTLGSASSALATAGSDAAAGGVSSLSMVQAAPPGPRDDVIAEAAAAAPPMAAAAPAMMAPVSDSAASAMTMDANVVSATPGTPAEGVALYAPEVADAAVTAKLAAETEPVFGVETFSAREPANLASPSTAATSIAADQVVAGDVSAPVAPAVEQPAQPSATAAAPTSIPVAAAQLAPEETVSIAPAPEPLPSASSNSIWVWLQVAAALGVLGFGILWWRTRLS